MPSIPLSFGEAARSILPEGLTPDTEIHCWGIFGEPGAQTKKGHRNKDTDIPNMDLISLDVILFI